MDDYLESPLPAVGTTSILFWGFSLLWGMCFMCLVRLTDARAIHTASGHELLMFFGCTMLSAIGTIFALAGLGVDQSRRWIAFIGLLLNTAMFATVMTRTLGH